MIYKNTVALAIGILQQELREAHEAKGHRLKSLVQVPGSLSLGLASVL